MNKAQELIKTLEYLEQADAGRRYTLTIARGSAGWLVSATGESTVDKSLPNTFLSVQAENFDLIPDLVAQKAAGMVQVEIERNLEAAKKLDESNQNLQVKIRELKEFTAALDTSRIETADSQ